MRHIRYARRHSISESRKVPLNTIVLPPLTSPSEDNPKENRTEILGKFVVLRYISGRSFNGQFNGFVYKPPQAITPYFSYDANKV